MKKNLFLMFICMFTLLLVTACSGSGYDKEVCEQLKNKIENEEELTDEDYSTMIDQVCAGMEEMKRIKKETEGDAEKEKALLDDKDFTDMVEYVIGFSMQLEKDAKKLSPENAKKVLEMGEKAKELKD